MHETILNSIPFSLLLGLNYLVDIDGEGRLRWARNGRVVDTAAGRWSDSGNGGGIVENPEARTRRGARPNDTSSISSEEDTIGTHYAGQSPAGDSRWASFRRRLTLQGAMDRLLRLTVRKNTWVYVTVGPHACYRI